MVVELYRLLEGSKEVGSASRKFKGNVSILKRVRAK